MRCTKPFYRKGENGYVLTACGKCINCRKQIAFNYTRRVKEHMFYNPKGFFATLTYDGEKEGTFSLSTTHLQKFFKRLRKKFSDRKISYLACGEYGRRFDRPHYHALIFGLSIYDLDLGKIGNKLYSNTLLKIWHMGYNNVAPIVEERIYYTTGYILKKKFDHVEKGNREREFIHISKNFGANTIYDNWDEWYEKYRNQEENIPSYYSRRIRELSEKFGYVVNEPKAYELQNNKEEAIRNLLAKNANSMREALINIELRNKQTEIDYETLVKIKNLEGEL